MTTLWLFVVFSFVNASTFQQSHLQLTMEYLAGMKFHELTYG